MFRQKTVFITGAGASVHYGYPTGADLIVKTIAMATELANFYEYCFEEGLGNMPKYFERFDNGSRILKWRDASFECKDFVRRMENAAPTVIDYFLGQNMALADLGKFLIAMVIFRLWCK